jgi:hypothetical protein
MADKDWQRGFEDPIPLPGGRTLITLREAADYITGLPKNESDLPERVEPDQAHSLPPILTTTGAAVFMGLGSGQIAGHELGCQTQYSDGVFGLFRKLACHITALGP